MSALADAKQLKTLANDADPNAGVVAMNVDDAMRSLHSKFTSGNDVPVSEARITRDEWNAVQHLARDAARYRWLRDKSRQMSRDPDMSGDHSWLFGCNISYALRGPTADAAIDAAMAREVSP